MNYIEKLKQLHQEKKIGFLDEYYYIGDYIDTYEHILSLLGISDITFDDVCCDESHIQASLDIKRGDKLYFIVFDTDVGRWIGDGGIEESIIGHITDILNGYIKAKADFNL